MRSDSTDLASPLVVGAGQRNALLGEREGVSPLQVNRSGTVMP